MLEMGDLTRPIRSARLAPSGLADPSAATAGHQPMHTTCFGEPGSVRLSLWPVELRTVIV
jgi:hypothetical protein